MPNSDNRRELRIILGLFVLVVILLVLNVMQADAAFKLVAVNQDLLRANRALIEAPHPVHDCDVTAWHNNDGTISIMINGLFEHILYDTCRRL